MKKYFVRFCFFLIFATAQTILTAQVDTLTILNLNDTHSTLSSVGPRDPLTLEGTQGGISRAATIIGITKLSDPNVLTIHAGDVYMGDLFFNKYFGAAEFQLLNGLGLDAMTLGNHEWDLGPEVLLASFQASFLPGEGFPFLCSNLVYPGIGMDDSLREYIYPYSIKQVGNIKVGIFGLTTPETNILSQPYPYFIDTNIVQIAANMVDTLTAQNCNVVIMLSHLGLELDKIIANYVPGINVIVGGHDHALITSPFPAINPSGDTTWIVQDSSNYLYMGKLQLLVNSGIVNKLNYQVIQLDETIPEDPTVKNEVDYLIAGIEAEFGPLYSQQIATATGYFGEVANSLTEDSSHDTPIGNLVTDAFRYKTGTDIAIEAGGSTAQPLYPGPIVGADLFRVFGYGFNKVDSLGFRLVTFNILGSDLWVALESVLAMVESNDEFLPQVSGMQYTFDINKAPGQRLVSVNVGEGFIDPATTYSVTGNEFLYYVLTDSSQLHIPVTNVYRYQDSTEFEVLEDYVAAQQTITPQTEGRIITSINKNEGRNIPYKYKLMQNYPNPFNPTTNFKFRIAKLGLVTLKIYDILGREVATIVNKELHPGEYKYQWNARGFASGVYFYRLKAGKFVETKKLILLK